MIARLLPSRSGPPLDLKVPAPIRVLLLIFGGYLAVRHWWPMLSYGFNSDEYLSLWVTSDGFTETIRRSHNFQGNGPVYFVLLWGWRQIVGSAPLMLALPSLACFGATLWHTYCLGRDLDRPETGWVAMFVLAMSGPRIGVLLEVRPYGLLVLAIVLAARALVRWLADGRQSDGLRLVAWAWLALAMSPFAGLVAIAWLFVVVATARQRPLPKPSSLLWMGGLAAALGALLVPQLLVLAGRGEELSFAPMPDVSSALRSFSMYGIVVAFLVAILVFRSPIEARLDLARPTLWLVIAWAVSSTLGLFFMSRLTGNSVFVLRYLLPAWPGVALVAAVALVRIAHPPARFAALLGLVLIAGLGYESEALGEPGWRPAIEWAQEQLDASDQETAVVFDLDLVESNVVSRADDPAWTPYLLAPLEHHGVVDNERFGLPAASTDEGVVFVETLMDDLTVRFDSVAVVANRRSTHLARVEQRLVDAGFVRTDAPATGWRAQASLYRNEKSTS